MAVCILFSNGVQKNCRFIVSQKGQFLNRLGKKYTREVIFTNFNETDNWYFLSSKHLAIQCHWSQRPAVIGDVLQVYSGSEGRAIIFCETKKNVTEMAMNPHIKQVSLF